MLFAECFLGSPRFFLAYVMLLKICCVIFILWVSFAFRLLGLQMLVWPARLCIIHRHTCSQARNQIEINSFFFLIGRKEPQLWACKPAAPSTHKLFWKHPSKAFCSRARGGPPSPRRGPESPAGGPLPLTSAIPMSLSAPSSPGRGGGAGLHHQNAFCVGTRNAQNLEGGAHCIL